MWLMGLRWVKTEIGQVWACLDVSRWGLHLILIVISYSNTVWSFHAGIRICTIVYILTLTPLTSKVSDSYKNTKKNKWVSKAKLTSTTIFLARGLHVILHEAKNGLYHIINTTITSKLPNCGPISPTPTPPARTCPMPYQACPDMPKTYLSKNFEFCVKIHFLCLSFIILHPVPGSCFLFVIPCFCSTLNRF